METLSTWASCQIRKIAGCACAGNAGNVFPRGRLQRKLLVSDPDMHHGTCVTHVPWCMSGSLNRGGGENFPGIPGACATRNITYLARGPLQKFRFVFVASLKNLLYKKMICRWFQTPCGITIMGSRQLKPLLFVRDYIAEDLSQLSIAGWSWGSVCYPEHPVYETLAIGVFDLFWKI